MFGMMVLLITLLKITNSCCVWVPSEAPIFNRNEWYNTVDLKSQKSQISHRVHEFLILRSDKGDIVKDLNRMNI